jgi:2-keto-4-pentenoate hydratase/2-oxohepta-3-ene-1,7-dioic acid hydratase in catechol pathway
MLVLVCDGAYYDVAELEARLGHGPPRPVDFRARVLGLGCAGLRELDERVRAGFRPTEARLLAGSFLPLACCDTDRAALVQMGPYDLDTGQPVFRLRDARSLVGDGQYISFPAHAAEPRVEAAIAVVLADDIVRATPEQAARAILGYALALDWYSSASSSPWPARLAEHDAGAQLGPLLVMKHELGAIDQLRAWLAVDGEQICAGKVGDWRFSVAESLAYVSQFQELRAGDVVSAGKLRCHGPSSGPWPRYGSKVTIKVERLGELTGTPVRGPAIGRWRSARRPTPA